jgi:DNA-binding MarR family transcriptional regulator
VQDVERDVTDAIVEAWARELPAASGLPLELSKRAGRLAAILDDATTAQLTRFGLTKAEYHVLSVLRSVGAPYRLRPTDLAARLLLSSGGTSNVLRRLTDTGLIDRQADERDARSTWVHLTDEGVRLAEKAVLAATDAHTALLRAVPEERARAAADVLRDVLIALGDADP